MKKILSLLALFSLLPICDYAEIARKSVPEWYTGESKRDNSLKSNESVFEIHFMLMGHSNDDESLPDPKFIVYMFNGIQDTFPLDSSKNELFVKPGKYKFIFYASRNYREIYTDSILIKGGYRTPLYINFKPSLYEMTEDKPVIYVYSQDTQQVNIQLDLQGKLGFTYPAYNGSFGGSGWSFTAFPNGELLMTSKSGKEMTYQYLFWDGKMDIDYSAVNWNEGFVVARDSLVPFFEKNLTAMGLSPKEIDDYITYWCPRMLVNEKNYIHFMMNDVYNEYATLNVSPEPDHIFRMSMLWSPADPALDGDLVPQTFNHFTRGGLTLVEWGGAELDHQPAIFQEWFDQ